jgi:hypothetical protein
MRLLRRGFTCGLLGIGSALTSLTPAWAPAEAAGATARSRIVGAGGDGLFTMDYTGADRRLLFSQSGWFVDDFPMASKWSPDGSWIAYNNQGELWVIRSDGTGKRRISAGDPAWSADGRIVYDWMGDGYHVDGTLAAPFSRSSGGPAAHEKNTAWSPDGTRVAFASDMGDGRWRTYVSNADGSGLRPITTGRMDEIPFDWSPDGRSLVLWAIDQTITSWIVVVDADGSNRRQIKENFVPIAFSPDGRKILAYEAHLGRTHIMRVDGTGLTHVPALQGAQDWGPGSVDPDPAPAPSTTVTPTTKPAAPPPMPVPPTTAPRTKSTVAPRSAASPEATTSTSQPPPAPTPDPASLSALASATGEIGGSEAALAGRAIDAASPPSPVGRAPFVAASVVLLATVGLAAGRTALRRR